jgi:hypothetical protein
MTYACWNKVKFCMMDQWYVKMLCEFFWIFPLHFQVDWYFSSLLVKHASLCDIGWYYLYEILIWYWMNMKFGMLVIDTWYDMMLLVPFISLLFSLTYEFLKWMHVLMLWFGSYNCVCFCWFSLTWFPLSNWAKIWHAIPWTCPV